MGLLKNTVSKKGRSVYAWSIRSEKFKACPFSTSICRSLCYAEVGNFCIHRKTYAKQFNFSMTNQFVPAITKELEDILERSAKRERTISCCIHEAGDFVLESVHEKMAQHNTSFSESTTTSILHLYEVLDQQRILPNSTAPSK